MFSRPQRRWLWTAFLVMAGYAPLAAYLIDDATWLFSVVISAVIGFVLIADDFERRAGRE